jgi:hypothetical protein
MVVAVKDMVKLDNLVLVEVVEVVHLVLEVGVVLVEVALNLAKLVALVVTGEIMAVTPIIVEMVVVEEEQLLGLDIV